MVLKRIVKTDGVTLNALEGRRIGRQLDALERRLVHHPEPVATLALTGHPAQRSFEADLRVRLGPHGIHLVSHQSAGTVGQVTRLAVEDVERQLERRLAVQRGEPSYGVPSRRPWRSRTPRGPEAGA